MYHVPYVKFKVEEILPVHDVGGEGGEAAMLKKQKFVRFWMLARPKEIN